MKQYKPSTASSGDKFTVNFNNCQLDSSRI